MSKFKDGGKKELPPVSTASLPDIIFMLLFFFMVTTVMREVDLKVKVELPDATEVDKLESKALVDYIYIGPPTQVDLYGEEPRIQLDDQFAKLEDINSWKEEKQEIRDEKERPVVTTSLKVDKETNMKIITDVKQELRVGNHLKINYSTTQGR